MKLGPPRTLNLQEYTELLRAMRGILPSWHLDSRSTAETPGIKVDGSKHAAGTTIDGPPMPITTAQVGPFTVTWGPTPGAPGTFRAKVSENGVFLSSPCLSDTIAVSNLNTYFNLNPNDTIWLQGPVTSQLDSDGTAAIKSFGRGDTGYDQTAGPWQTGGPVVAP